MDEFSPTTFLPEIPIQPKNENSEVIGTVANEEINIKPNNGFSKKKKFVILTGGFLIVVLIIIYFFFRRSSQPLSKFFNMNQFKSLNIFSPSTNISPSLQPEENFSVTTKEVVSPTEIIVPTTAITSTATITPRSIIQATLTPTPIPRIPSPPTVEILSPREMQTVELTNSNKDLCISESNNDGQITQLQRRQNINDSGWSSYSNYSMLCFEPKEGLNKLQVQYKNKYGDESSITTRQFSFHRFLYFTVNLSGTIYRDCNCNGIRDSGENTIDTSATVNLINMPEYSMFNTINSDNGGNFHYSFPLAEDESKTINVSVVSPSGYKSSSGYPETIVNFNKSNLSQTVSIPQVPNEFVSNCH